MPSTYSLPACVTHWITNDVNDRNCSCMQFIDHSTRVKRESCNSRVWRPLLQLRGLKTCPGDEIDCVMFVVCQWLQWRVHSFGWLCFTGVNVDINIYFYFKWMYNLVSVSSTCFGRHSAHHQEHNCSLVYVFSHRFSVEDRSFFLVSCGMGPCVFCVYSGSWKGII
jgi:hypothetical protein